MRGRDIVMAMCLCRVVWQQCALEGMVWHGRGVLGQWCVVFVVWQQMTALGEEEEKE